MRRLYMAPEILSGEKYDAKADLWSVGAVLYEMSVGKAPFRAQNHIELLKKISNSKGIRFPDEDPRETQRAHSNGEEIQIVPDDVKKLIRGLLKRIPAERLTFDQFFTSTAMENSKFPRPIRDAPPPPPEPDHDSGIRASIPEHHRVIPPEVLDPKAIIPPSKFNFRRREYVIGGRSVPAHSCSFGRLTHMFPQSISREHTRWPSIASRKSYPTCQTTTTRGHPWRNRGGRAVTKRICAC